MFMVYFRIIVFILALMGIYIIGLFYVPVIGETIDTTLGKEWNAQLKSQVEALLGRAQEAQSALENRIDNPAPNMSRNIEGRIGGE